MVDLMIFETIALGHKTNKGFGKFTKAQIEHATHDFLKRNSSKLKFEGNNKKPNEATYDSDQYSGGDSDSYDEND
jgi:hypothetical protein